MSPEGSSALHGPGAPDISGEYDVAVVGAGIGGLMTAALLARRGRRVVVLEATMRIGGYQCEFVQDGFRIQPHFHFLQDAGPGRPVRRLLDELGIELDWRRVDPVLRLCWPDRTVTMPADRDAYLRLLCAEFPGERMRIERFFATTAAIHRAVADLPVLAPVLARYGGDTTADFVARFVRDPILAAVLGGWAAYFGYGAHRIAAVAIAEFTEACFDGGVLQPDGGIAALTDALRGVIESYGGQLLLSAPVERIGVDEGKATGVRLADGRAVSATTVVSGVDVVRTLRMAGLEPGRLSGIEPFRSPFSVFLGVRVDGLTALQGAGVAVVFPGYDSHAQDDAQLAGRVAEAPVSVGVPTVLNPALAPDGHQIALLYTFTTAERTALLAADPAAAQRYADELVAAAERALPGLRDSVVTRAVSVGAVPSIYQGTGGALGWAPTPEALIGSRQAARLLRTPVGGAGASALTRALPGVVSRLASRALPGVSTPLRGLYCVGQWTSTGAGMNNVCRSAALVADHITR
jgi:phytoene dehydrogenase-like protein